MALQVKKRYPVPLPSRSPETLPQRKQRREQRRNTFRRSSTSALVMITLAVAGGIGYTWYVGQQKTATIAQATKASPAPAMFKPPKVASNAKIGVAAQTVSSPVKPGENASITIRTNPEASCTISVKYNNMVANDSGLTPRVSDEFGITTWAWTVPAAAPVGKWPVLVVCKNKSYTGQLTSDLVVAK